MNVTIVKDSYCPYLVSTSEVQFSKGDTVSAKLRLLSSARTPRLTRLRRYRHLQLATACRYTYDNKLANEITSGKITQVLSRIPPLP